MIKQTAALIPPQDLLMCSHIKVPWSHVDFSLAGPLLGVSYLNSVDSFSRRLEFISVRSAIKISSLRQVFAIHGSPKFFSARFEDVCCNPSIVLLHAPSSINGLDEQLVDNLKGNFSHHKVKKIGKDSLFFTRYRTTHQIDVKIWMPRDKNLRSQYAGFTFCRIIFIT
ncbi:hypothetical protein ACTXT7_002703 [Hymenolepis weldensis]